MRGEAVAQRMWRGEFRNAAVAHRLPHVALQCLRIGVVPPFFAAARINAAPLRRENILPCPITISGRIFTRQRKRQIHATETGFQVARV